MLRGLDGLASATVEPQWNTTEFIAKNLRTRTNSAAITEARVLLNEVIKRTQLLVIGSAADHCTPEARKLGYEVGAEAAKRGAIVLTGGLGGVMEAACKGAKDNNGITVGVIPQDELHYANRYCDVVIATGMGWARDFITAYSSDAAVIVAGGAGALIEASAAYLKSKPIVAIGGSGGVADQIKETFLDERRTVRILTQPDPKRAVEKALELAGEKSE